MRVRLTALNLCSRLPSVRVLFGTVVVIAFAVGSQHGVERPAADDRGIGLCPVGAEEDLLSPDALQCWFRARQGRWRTLSCVSAHGALVVEVEAADTQDAEEIAQRFATAGRDRFLEVLVYIQPESAGAAPFIRRIRWTRQEGFETLEFAGASAIGG